MHCQSRKCYHLRTMAQEKYSAIICPNCGKPVFLQEKKCKYCGHKLTDEEISKPSTKQGKDGFEKTMEVYRKKLTICNQYTKEHPYPSNSNQEKSKENNK